MIYRNLQQIHFQVMRFSNPHSVGHKSHPKNQRWMRWMRLVENSSIGCIPDNSRYQTNGLTGLTKRMANHVQMTPETSIYNWGIYADDTGERCHHVSPMTWSHRGYRATEGGIQWPSLGATGDMCHLGPEHAAKK
jgi:hypothetical protein